MGIDVPAVLKRIVAEQLDVAVIDVRDGANLVEDLGADSIALVELALAVEESFNLVIPDAEAEKLRTVRDAIAYIEARLRQ